MRLYTHQAEQILFDKAKSISEQHNSWRCIYIDFTSHKDQCSDGLRTHVVTNIIKELQDGEDGYIYLCDDGDVFILFQGKTKEIIEKLGEHFKWLGNSKHSAHLEDNFFNVLDLSQSWEQFYTLCRDKAVNISKEHPNLQRIASAAQPALRDPDRELFNAALAKRPNRQRLLVLVVEDDSFTRRLFTGTLKADYDILEAGDGAEAVRAFEGHAPDVVFLDIELPDTNGHVILHKMLACDKAAFIVMLSANSVKENILAALEKGAQGFVTKPFAKEKLMHYLRLGDNMRRSNAGAAHA